MTLEQLKEKARFDSQGFYLHVIGNHVLECEAYDTEGDGSWRYKWRLDSKHCALNTVKMILDETITFN